MMKIQQIKEKVNSLFLKSKVGVLVFLLFVFGLYAFMSINLHNHFLTYGLDLGVFDEWIWKVSRGKFPYSGVGCNWLIEDHFQIILYFLAPLFWLWDNVRMILLAQSAVMVFAGLPLFLLAERITRNLFFSLAVVFAYLFFLGTQFAVLNEFHQITFAPFFIAWAYFFLEKKKFRFFFWSIFFLFLIKEEVALLIGAIGLGLIFWPGYRKIGLTLVVLGFSFFFFLVYIFLPFISIKGVYDHFHFGEIGRTPFEIIMNIFSHPWIFFHSLIWPSIKIKTIFQSLTTFALFPLFAPLKILIPLFFDFSIRFLYAGPQTTRWALVNHHGASSSMFLALAAIYGARNIRSVLKNKWWRSRFFNLAGGLLVLTTIFNDFIFHGPVNSLFKKQFYEEEFWVKEVREVLARVPAEVSVSAQNNLAPHLTHRQRIYRLPFGLNSEYLVVQLHPGLSNYAFAPLTYQEMKALINDLIASKRYSLAYEKGEAKLLRRNYKTDLTKSRYFNDTKHCYYFFEED